MANYKQNRKFLNDDCWAQLKAITTDQQQRLPQPPLQKPYPDDTELIGLADPEHFKLAQMPLLEAINSRKSVRKFAESSLTDEELSFLLWATQGVKNVSPQGTTTMRTVPSGGARHPFETYLLINRVEGLEPGLYRFLAIEHKLLPLGQIEGQGEKTATACLGQKWATNAAVVFVWSCVPYRAEWRYHVAAAKTIALDAGHVCQSLYLASPAVGCGCCAIGAYDQAKLDQLIGVDGTDEFAIYVAPVGKLRS